MNGILVGELRQKPTQLSFEYSQSWIERKGSRALSQSLPFGASLSEEAVQAYFDNLLPDNLNIKRDIVSRLGAKSIATFDLLESIGLDCPGAVALSPDPPSENLSALELQACSEQDIAAQIKHTRMSNTLGMQENGGARFCLAGSQPQTALTRWNNMWHTPVGNTATTHILKPPRPHHKAMNADVYSSVDNEWFCLHVLRELGMPVVQADIEQFEDERVSVVERVDRNIKNDAIIRLPQEDFCQAFGCESDNKFEEHGGPGAKEIMDLLSLSLDPVNDRSMFMKSQVLNWLLASNDGHAKNYSIFLKEKGFCLTPFSNVLSAYPHFGIGNMHPTKIKMAMKLQCEKSLYYWHEIQAKHWLSHASHLGFPTLAMKKILEEVSESMPEVLSKVSRSAPPIFKQNVGDVITNGTLACIERMRRQLAEL